MWQTKWNQIYLMSSLTFLCSFPGAFDLAHLLRPTIHVCLSTNTVKYGLQVTFYLPKYCKKVPIYCIKIQVKSWFVAINTSTEK